MQPLLQDRRTRDPRTWGTDGEFEARVHLVDDPVWAGAAPDAVLAAVTRDEELSVVFVADEVTMRSPHRALLALTTQGRGRRTEEAPRLPGPDAVGGSGVQGAGGLPSCGAAR
ncbi:DUF6924 domain-containing protein [Streptomyces uncialis]|uniref:DUF6924 domain-containing protein n=1 Tax=Streptomyces uncialis TaxID=1048205 RepID=UPI0036697BD8